MLKDTTQKIIDFFKKVFIHDHWHIGVFNCEKTSPIHAWEKPGAISWVPKRNGTYVADPFIITYKKQSAIFFEEYIFGEDRGQLACRTVTRDENKSLSFGDHLTISLPSPKRHRSYPFIFEDNNELWMLPEENASGNIVLYKCEDFPNEWSYAGILIENFPGIDATLIKHADKYWIFTTHANNPHENLHIFWADQLTGPWTPHVQNPIKLTHDAVRCGGPLYTENNNIYRVAQNCVKTYGANIAINRIDTLTTEEYKETPIRTIEPWGSKMRGMHTISHDRHSDICAFDIKTRACLNDILSKYSARLHKSLRKRFIPASFL